MTAISLYSMCTHAQGHPIRGGPVRAVRRLVGHGLFAKPAAHKLVTKWEAAKAAAMGRRHQARSLLLFANATGKEHWRRSARMEGPRQWSQKTLLHHATGGQAGRGADGADAGALAGAGPRSQGRWQVIAPHLTWDSVGFSTPDAITQFGAVQPCRSWVQHFSSCVVRCSYVEYDLQEVTIEELEVSRAVNEARIVATIDETRSWVDAKTGQASGQLADMSILQHDHAHCALT